jgi:hypothetical protein
MDFNPRSRPWDDPPRISWMTSRDDRTSSRTGAFARKPLSVSPFTKQSKNDFVSSCTSRE